MTKPVIGFIGLGAMGGPMAENLLNAGFTVVSCANRNRDEIERLKAKGLKEAANPAEVGAEADILMSIVWDEAQNDKILRGPDGALNTLKPGACVLIMSTLSPVYCQELAKEAAAKDIAILDCPVSGMPKGAREGTLSLMIGGDSAAIEKCRPALEPMGKVLPCGPIGAGQVTKLGNNAMFLATFRALFEVRDMVRGFGMDPKTFLEILNQSTGRSFLSENIRLPDERFDWPAMPIKDLSACLEVGKSVGVDMDMIQLALELGRD